MKSSVILKLPILLCCFGAFLLFAPACKAQSEVDPDHFDSPNTEPLEKVSPLVASKTNHVHQKPVLAQARTRKTNSSQTMQLANAHENSAPQKQALVLSDKRKTVPRKSNKR